MAAPTTHADCLKLLLAAGGDVNKCKNDDTSPISIAAMNGHADCLKLLLAAGGDVNKCDKDGFFPIFLAVQNGHADCLKLLLAAGGDVNKCVSMESANLHFTYGSGGYSTELVAKLSLSRSGFVCQTIDSCASKYNEQYVCYVLSVDFEPCSHVSHHENDVSVTVIFEVKGDGSLGDLQPPSTSTLELVHAVRMSVSSSKVIIDTQSANHIRGTLLYRLPADCLKLLLAAGGDVNKCNNNGVSPIYTAAEKGHADCLKLLLAAGADPRSNFKGTFALDIARQKQHAECTRLLEAALT